MRQRFIQSFPTSEDIQTALDNKELGKPYVALSREEPSIDWNSKEINYAGMYFTIEALEDGNLAVSKSCQYSINGGEWISIASSATIAVSNGDEVRFKDDLKTDKKYMFSGNTIMSNVYGNIMSLMYGDNFVGQTTALSTQGLFRQYTGLKDAGNLILPTTLARYGYSKMFAGCTSLTTAPELPATKLADDCYAEMFAGCTSLAQAPELPATSLANYCYASMFSGCTSLTTAPELPARELAERCYFEMFYGCTNLAEAPNLPATTLTPFCYCNMFQGCASLTQAPEIMATTLAIGCCYGMFQDCTSLTQSPELPATNLADNCYIYMFQRCTSLATAPELPATKLSNRCYSNMFAGCTSLITAPKLPATNLVNYCYDHMFWGCTSLTTAPELPATSLADYCYNTMFYDCTNLNYIKCLATDITATDCTGSWVSRVASTGTFIKHPDATWTTGTNGIPTGWTVVDAEI